MSDTEPYRDLEELAHMSEEEILKYFQVEGTEEEKSGELTDEEIGQDLLVRRLKIGDSQFERMIDWATDNADRKRILDNIRKGGQTFEDIETGAVADLNDTMGKR